MLFDDFINSILENKEILLKYVVKNKSDKFNRKIHKVYKTGWTETVIAYSPEQAKFKAFEIYANEKRIPENSRKWMFKEFSQFALAKYVQSEYG
jgi:hypothetical protein